MKKETFNISTIKIIRIIKNISAKELAEHFEVSPAYVNAIENNQKNFRSTTLKYGLINLGIPYESYKELEDFIQNLSMYELSNHYKYVFSLVKGIGVLYPELKEDIDAFLNKNLTNKIKTR